jgi:hypothetical protein
LVINSYLKIFSFKSFFQLSNNNYCSLLQDIVLFERYLRRKFSYKIKLRLNSSLITKQKKITLLRAPFVHKISQEQFHIQYFQKKIEIFFNTLISSLKIIIWLLKKLNTFILNLPLTSFSKFFYKLSSRKNYHIT